MINKELLRKVLGYTNDCRIICIEEEYRNIKYDIVSPVNGHYTERINTFELIHKCKDWMFFKGYTFEIEWIHDSEPQDKTRCVVRLGKYGTKGVAGSEQEAIFKACQWVLENEDKNE